MTSPVSRVGIVAKSHLRAATQHLTDIEAWLSARGADAVFETATAALMAPSATRQVADKSTLVTSVDLVVVLGGDGTLLSIADARLDPIKQLVIDECLRVARADGVTFEIDFIKALAEVFGPSRNTASMRQDLLKRKPTEIDHMNGAVVALGQRYGIGCPVNGALVVLIKALETQGLG